MAPGKFRVRGHVPWYTPFGSPVQKCTVVAANGAISLKVCFRPGRQTCRHSQLSVSREQRRCDRPQCCIRLMLSVTRFSCYPLASNASLTCQWLSFIQPILATVEHASTGEAVAAVRESASTITVSGEI